MTSPHVVTRTEVITPGPAQALAGLLDIAAPPLRDGDPLPPLWHWIYLLEKCSQSALGHDGHPTVGIPAPSEPGQLRMFAGGRVTAHTALRCGESATRSTQVAQALVKEGKSGRLTFVTVRSTFEQGGNLALVEEQDIVYRAASSRLQPQTPALNDLTGQPLEGRGHLEMNVDPVVLFRFSALTYNAHRIHYDSNYAAAEGYPGLVVHGPLQALLMGECFRRSGESMIDKQFAYRLVAPTYGTQRVAVHSHVQGEGLSARVQDGGGRTTATATLQPFDALPPFSAR